MRDRVVRVLVINDSLEDLLIIETYLQLIEAWRAEIKTTQSISDGFALLESWEADIVVVDYRVGKSKDLETIAALRKARRVPVIVVSGEGDASVAVRVMNAGASDFLPKRILSASSIERSVTNALEKSDLLSNLEQSNADLLRVNEDLRQRNSQIESFHHILSHELRTPLTAVREFVSLVLEGVAGQTTTEQDRYLEIACDSCDQMRLLLDDILDATRLDTGKLRIDPSPKSIGPVVERVLAGMESKAEEAGVVVRTFVSHDLPRVTVDESRFAQVIGNLVSNAIKFTPPGGTVDVYAQDCRESGVMTVEVRDQGCGIPPEHADHIFERLYQVPGSAPSEKGGLGLGLAISKHIVELHGGQLSVVSEPGVGSSFYFTLPLASAETPVSS